MHKFVTIVKKWLSVAFLVTVLAALTYVAVQQVYRQSANDPQIQMAEDAALALGSTTSTQSVNLSGTVDIAKSLSPYLVFYNASGTPTGGNGLLNGKFPLLPQGVFAYTASTGEDRVTWQPAPGIRQAIIVVAVTGTTPGFVMAGRSLRETEYREDQLELLTDIAWITALIGTFALEALAIFWKT